MALRTKAWFRHQPLAPEGQLIRLFKVQYQRRRSESIHIQLQHFDLRRRPPSFKAISYLWGPPELFASVVIDGHEYTIRKNLYSFLQMISKDKKFCNSTWLWTDCISIDQSNLDERNQQVNQMSTIYKTAEQVLVWLGPSFPGGAKLTKAINRWPHWWRRMPFGDPDLVLLNPFEEITNSRDQLLAPTKILSDLEYWMRLWIQQEIVLARDIVLYISDRHFSWQNFMRFINDITSNILPYYWGDSLICLNATKLERERQEYRTAQSIDWLRGTDLPAFTLCSVPVDRFYGILGLINPEQAIEVDYNLSVEEVCLRIVSRCIKQSRLRPGKQEIERYLSIGEHVLYAALAKLLDCKRLRSYVHDEILKCWPDDGSSQGACDNEVNTYMLELRSRGHDRVSYCWFCANDGVPSGYYGPVHPRFGHVGRQSIPWPSKGESDSMQIG